MSKTSRFLCWLSISMASISAFEAYDYYYEGHALLFGLINPHCIERIDIGRTPRCLKMPP